MCKENQGWVVGQIRVSPLPVPGMRTENVLLFLERICACSSSAQEYGSQYTPGIRRAVVRLYAT